MNTLISSSLFWGRRFSPSSSTSSGSTMSSSTSLLESRASSMWFARFSLSFGFFTLSRLLSRFSIVPNSAISSSAVFGPTPGTPGMLSEVSPISPNSSGICAGVTPNFLTHSSGPYTSSFIVSYIFTPSPISWNRSLSPVMSVTSNPAFAAFRATAAITSSASSLSTISTGMLNASTILWI